MTYIQWLSLGIVLIVLEFFVPGTYLMWFGFSACVVATTGHYCDKQQEYPLNVSQKHGL